jgi:predicted translin family RNA/ssDNA-binding protein
MVASQMLENILSFEYQDKPQQEFVEMVIHMSIIQKGRKKAKNSNFR